MRNDTVIQAKGTAGVPSSFLLYASQVCQLCHDPTDTVTVGTDPGPIPVSGVP